MLARPQLNHSDAPEPNTLLQASSENPSTIDGAGGHAAVQLSERYYLDNFNYLIAFVTRHYQHLLNLNELDFCSTYSNLSSNAQQVFVRISSRTHALLRTSKLNYPEISDISAGIDELHNAQFVNKEVEFTDCDFTHLFSQAELKTALNIKSTQFDPASINTRTLCTPDLFGDSPLEQLLTNDSLIEVHHKEHIVTFRLLFFGNLHQDFSSFVLRDLGLRRYESYHIDSATVLFQQRDQLEAHLHYYQCAELFENACDQGSDALQELHARLPVADNNDKTLNRRLSKLRNNIARQLEREGALPQAATIYLQSNRPPARERLARIEAKLGNVEQALTLCKTIQSAPFDTDELDFANTFGTRLAKKSECNFTAPSNHSPPEITLQLPINNLSVEFTTALHYAKTGKCYYLENNLFNGVFGLAFWDIIFAPVNGVFFHPFQLQPADFYEPEFTITRSLLITERLQQISNGQLLPLALKHYYNKRGLRNSLVNWQLTKPHILSLAINRIPTNDWLAIFKLILSDLRNYRSGQPDLIYFPDTGGYQLLEVKAPGDRLQKNQLRWMRFFHQQKMAHAVVHIERLELSR